MMRLLIEPLDLLLFRDGRPFGMGESASSIFPPSPLTFQGAVRAKLWANKDKIPQNWLDPEKPSLKFYGPFLEKDGVLLFYAPLFTLKCSLERGEFIKPRNWDLEGLQKVLWLKEEEEESGFISLDDFKNYLIGKPVCANRLSKKEDLVLEEERTSIKINPDKLTVSEEDALFRVRFLRLKKGVRFSLYVEAEKEEELLFEILEKEPRTLILGGERRAVRYELIKEDFKSLFEDIEERIDVGGKGIGKIIFLTPAIPE
ncbi:MAG: type III-B CRISPR module-associated protein Cmr3, partial [bacterium]